MDPRSDIFFRRLERITSAATIRTAPHMRMTHSKVDRFFLSSRGTGSSACGDVAAIEPDRGWSFSVTDESGSFNPQFEQNFALSSATGFPHFGQNFAISLCSPVNFDK